MATGGRSDSNKHMAWIGTIGGMIAADTIVKARCDACGASKLADLISLERHLGSRGSLLDRSPPCWRPGCGGKVTFYASPGSGTPFRPCITMAGSLARFRQKEDHKDHLKRLRNG